MVLVLLINYITTEREGNEKGSLKVQKGSRDVWEGTARKNRRTLIQRNIRDMMRTTTPEPGTIEINPKKKEKDDDEIMSVIV